MALGTTNLNLRTSLYSEMGKGTGGSNYSLGQCKFGANDIDISNYAAANPSMVKMSYWKNYDHDNLRFRFNPVTSLDRDTYAATTTNGFNAGGGLSFNNNGATEGENWWDFDGGSNQAQFDTVNSGVGYKVAPSGTGVIGFWIYPQDNSAGQTVVLGNDIPYGTLSAYRGYRLDITTAMKIRTLRGDGQGTASGDRRTFESSGTLTQDAWNFVAWQGVYNSTTVSTSANYYWIYRLSSNTWSNGGSFLSGTGGNLAYSSGDPLSISTSSNGGRYFQGSIGGIYAFNQSMLTADIEDLVANTKSTYPG
jgi:hypothetical protein